MGTKTLTVAATILAAGLGLADDGRRAQAQEAGGLKQVTLKIEGEPGTEYSGECSWGAKRTSWAGGSRSRSPTGSRARRSSARSASKAQVPWGSSWSPPTTAPNSG